MIDLNDVWRPPEQFDLPEIRRRLAATAPEWLPGLFPNARMAADRKALRCADLSGRAPRGEGSCVLHLKGPYAGSGYNHATGEFAAGIDLIHHATGLADRDCFRGGATGAPGHASAADGGCGLPARSQPRYCAHPAELPLLASTEAYLRSRGLEDPCSPDLLFNADLTDFETARGWAGMVAIVRDGKSLPTGGIHRTFLLDDGSAKAPARPRRCWGPWRVVPIRLFPMTPDGRLGIAEGIETALAAHRIFGLPVWAALSADGVRRWQWPDGVTHVTVFADAGDAETPAAATLADRLNDAGNANRIVRPNTSMMICSMVLPLLTIQMMPAPPDAAEAGGPCRIPRVRLRMSLLRS